MKKTVQSRVDSNTVEYLSTTHDKSFDLVEYYSFIDNEQTIYLTTIIGTQLLLTASPPDYPIMKATAAVPEKMF